MKTLCLMTESFGSSGGIAYYNRYLSIALSRMSLKSEVCILQRVKPVDLTNQEFPFENIQINHNAYGGLIRFFFELVKELLFKRYDLIFCGHINLLPFAFLASVLFGVKVIVQVHGVDVWKRKSIFYLIMLRKVSRVFSVSEFTKNKMNMWACLNPDKFSVIPNCIDIEKYGNYNKANKVNEYASDARTIITIARLSSSEKYKGVDQIIELMPRLIKYDNRLQYHVVGDGDDLCRLRDKSVLLGVDAHVRFYGYLEEDKKIRLLCASNLFAMPGFGEGFGIVYLEAMACGVPVLGSSVDGSREALMHGSLGVLVDPHDPDSLFLGIIRGLNMARGVPDGLYHFSVSEYIRRVHHEISRINFRD